MNANRFNEALSAYTEALDIHQALQSAEDLRTSGRYVVLTPQECIEQVRRTDGITLHPLMGGLDPEWGWKGLKLFVEKVMPRL